MNEVKKKIAFCATVDYHIKAFHLPYLKWFKDEGWEVHVIANGDLTLPYVDEKFNVCIQRSPLKTDNLKAYRELKKIMNENEYNLIHCHTPMGGVLTRLAARKNRKKGAKVIYTAHGFHFYKGAPYKNWFLYYPIEKWLSKYTDCLITINEEDYNIAKLKFYAKDIKHVHGVGVDLNKFSLIDKSEKQLLRSQYGYSEKNYILIYPGELSNRKNQAMLIEVVELLKYKIPNLKLLLPGKKTLGRFLENSAINRGVTDLIEFMGFRNDIKELVSLSDVAVSSSLQEGLAVNLMEAMASGKVVITTNCRGGADLVENNVNGFVVAINDSKAMANKILELYENDKLRFEMGLKGREKISVFSLDKVLSEMAEIYKNIEGEKK
ncbi:glycosyltransferase family 4 protein [Paenibacillus sp. FSL H7-0323]|uniref:glycosyltransferase family 4 protein n=1 Tax=Paenibacillus sp. FSL H7-0323 TaxID=2921433 RepID=UPI0030F59BB8